MRMTVRHHFDFGADREFVGDDLVRAEAWDALRTKSSGAFAMAKTRPELEEQLDARPDIDGRAAAIDALLNELSVQTLASYGVGGAVLELGLVRRAPERRIVVTDYADETLARLREILPEVDAVKHDLRNDGPLEADLHLFHRIDTELPNTGWRDVLRRFANERILVVATEVHDVSGLIREVRKGLQGGSRAGWARNRGAFEALWKRTHDARPLRMNDLDAWLLEPRSGGCA
jgi:hypothetical protein